AKRAARSRIEASQRHRLKNQRNQEALEHLRATVRTLKTQLRDERELIKQLIMCGAWHYNPAKGSGIGKSTRKYWDGTQLLYSRVSSSTKSRVVRHKGCASSTDSLASIREPQRELNESWVNVFRKQFASCVRV
ncbi:hypothetical protein AAVH_14135, partial [Aphelenchoides avenae]